jgi:hypothetical protein
MIIAQQRKKNLIVIILVHQEDKGERDEIKQNKIRKTSKRTIIETC